jgi:acetylornithine deacetylase/succinyl-diaminopimelate desuccinylase-like protein
MVISADGGQWSEEQPELSLGCRGICGLQIDVKGPETDLHSGQFGGAVLNPIHALVQLLNSMHDSDCRITVPGFYDDILPLSRDERARIAAVPFNESTYKKSVGVSTLFGEKGYTPLERLWVRPTLEVNGIWGGFQGEGSKTVLPSEAHAKITCRLVPDQRPERILRLIASHVERHASPGVKATVHLSDHGSRAYVVPANHPGNQAVSAVLKELYGKEPFRTRMGGTVPVCDMFLRRLNSYSVFLAFSLDDEMVHAPNEFFRISSFRRAQRAYCMLMGMLAKK